MATVGDAPVSNDILSEALAVSGVEDVLCDVSPAVMLGDVGNSVGAEGVASGDTGVDGTASDVVLGAGRVNVSAADVVLGARVVDGSASDVVLAEAWLMRVLQMLCWC